MSPLTGAQKGELQKALASAFPNPMALAQMLSHRLDKNYWNFAPPLGGVSDALFKLIEDAVAQGWDRDLVRAARAANPGNPDLVAFMQQTDMTSSPTRGPQLQKLISVTQGFLDVAPWRRALGEIEVRVGSIEYRGDPLGTGFLVGADRVLTNYHVVEHLAGDHADPKDIEIRFDYKMKEDGSPIPKSGVPFAFAEEWLLAFSQTSDVDEDPDPGEKVPDEDELDYALVRLAQPAGDLPIGTAELPANHVAEPGAPERGWVRLGKNAPNYEPDTSVLIMQHPVGMSLKLAIDDLLGLNANGTRVRYTTNTRSGSSGSPCFDINWNLIALHNSGDARTALGFAPEFNVGIPIERIQADLEDESLGLERES